MRKQSHQAEVAAYTLVQIIECSEIEQRACPETFLIGGDNVTRDGNHLRAVRVLVAQSVFLPRLRR